MVPCSDSSVAQRLQQIGVSNGYAYDIANGKRKPSDKLAIRIYRATGMKLGPVAGLDDSDIETLAKVRGV